MIDEAFLKKLIESGPEVLAYFTIQSIGAFCWSMEHDMADGRIPEKDWPAIDTDIKRARIEQLEVVKSLKLYGVESVAEDGKPSKDYWKWYRFWNDYVNSLTDQEFHELDQALTQELDVSTFKPKGSWKD